MVLRIFWMFFLSNVFLKVNGVYFEDVEYLHHYLTNKSRDIKPMMDQGYSVNVDVLLSISAIQDYDEITATLTFTAAFVFSWYDETKRWNPLDYGGINATKIPIMKTWMPQLVLRNGVDGFSFYTFKNAMDIETATTTYYANGKAIFTVFGLFHVTCESDVTYYPFDEHKCTIMVLTADALNDLTLSSFYGIYLGDSMPNSEWTIKPNSATTTKRAFTFDFLDASSSQDEIDFTITISREHLFPFLNIVLPVVTLSLAHLLVFLLPVESGERTSFSFTLLLTLVVFMTMVSDRLPASNNISGFNSFLLSQLISSILTTALVVFSIRLFYKDSNIAQLKIFYRVILFLYGLSCQCYIQRKKVKDSKTEDVHKRHERPSWKKVSLFFDRLCAWFLCVVYGTQLCIYGIIVISG